MQAGNGCKRRSAQGAAQHPAPFCRAGGERRRMGGHRPSLGPLCAAPLLAASLPPLTRVQVSSSWAAEGRWGAGSRGGRWTARAAAAFAGGSSSGAAAALGATGRSAARWTRKGGRGRGVVGKANTGTLDGDSARQQRQHQCSPHFALECGAEAVNGGQK